MRKQVVMVLVSAVLLMGATGRLLATDGYFSHGFGTGSKGLAGAGVALPFGPITPATNPGGLIFGGPGIDFGVSVFNPDREYDVTGKPSGYPGTFGLAPGVVRSDARLFPVPYFAYGRKVGVASMFGLAFYGNGGMNTTYNQPTFGLGPVVGVNLSQMFIAPTFSTKLGGKHGVGVSLLLAYQRFDAKGLGAFGPFSSDATKLTDAGTSSAMGAGVRVGYLGQWSRYLSVGASYQTGTRMGKFAKYAGLFAEQGSFDIPSNWVVGVAVKPTGRVDIAFDVQRINYSEVKAIGTAMLPALMSAQLGADAGAGFGWQGMTVVKTGVQIRSGGGWTWRAGYSHGGQPVPASEVLFNILAPGVIDNHASFGFSKVVKGSHALHLAVTRAFSNSVTGSNPLEAPGQQQIKLTMHQWDVEFGYSIRF
jgi:long-chain fatty acid transport protein